ncbi:MAG: hypothetical protein A3F31_05065 [Candidatus Levybacteria bacterium RIFCSPHIGHO2_12_FULL_38_12]|nr:MAG: hypothetical protein A2770_00260 [Candidatus Levybacteria bacterium RIFCSPHIGHO2_01_FULL_38_12]OGH21720.1 MAG: hypothetical protein A3D75_00840 [Candidatus Levybacteria bacterium RIFCSPHIGHO2_02_FULL_37_18]OGH22622.1 MAG: hypothetical protein A3F31_05065 [Candidatus Levybacteria bacterium RIFCSPHIGHO2_12_FULL_38_12]OGH33341.1 MAG: hypothetical protein A3A47_03790 [Candidatus Levybacteria bacterium RIFCSPLOWO2_01_FULL_37_20]OGH43730.1 MAG: hypothetical protein A3J14_04340 [Candidatus Lev
MLYSRNDGTILLKEFIIRFITANYLILKKIIRKELPIRNNTKILDIGCGTGILSQYFSNADYIGIDIDQNLIDFAKKKYPYKFITMSGDKITFPSNSFDAILIVGVIHHMNNNVSTNVLLHMKRILRKNGKALIIEAIPPIDAINFPGRLLRYFDEGHHIRNFQDYNVMFKKKFTIKKAYRQRGGIVDYGVFVLANSP